MYAVIASAIIVIGCVITIAVLRNDDKHDLNIELSVSKSKFKFTLKKHD